MLDAFVKSEYTRYSDAPISVGTITPLVIQPPKGTRFVRIDPSVDCYVEVGETPIDPMSGSMRVLANVPQDIMLNDEKKIVIKILASGTCTAAITYIE